MSDTGIRSHANGWLAGLRAGWRRFADQLTVLGLDGPPMRLEGTTPVATIDVGEQTVALRRFAEGGSTEIARLPRAEFTSANLRTALAAELERPRYLRDSFALRLPDAWALKRTLTLPMAARRNLDDLLDFELERQSPLDRSEVYHDYAILRTDLRARTMDVAWRIMRRKKVDPLIEICHKAGVELAVVALVSDERPPAGGTFPVSPGAVRLLHAHRWTVPALVVAIVVLLAAVVAGAYSRNEQANDAVLAKVAETRVAARSALRYEDQINASHGRAAALVAEKQRPMVTAMLAEVTRLLPERTWLTGFSYSEGEVRLQGYSSKASALIAIFDVSPLFGAAEFRAPVVQAQDRNLEQFDLALKLRRAAH
jgi:general secretion pathway protein L